MASNAVPKTNVVALRSATDRAQARLDEIHLRAPGLNAFAAELGSPDDWLRSALTHAKCVLPNGLCAGHVTVSAAALSLMVMKLEELLLDGPKIALPISVDA